MTKYTKESAMRVAKMAIEKVDGNKIVAGNTCSLAQCGALDYLANHGGYTVIYAPKASR